MLKRGVDKTSLSGGSLCGYLSGLSSLLAAHEYPTLTAMLKSYVHHSPVIKEADLSFVLGLNLRL